MTSHAIVSTEIGELRGATVTVWTYSVSHQTLTLRLQQPGRSGNTHLICRGCSRIEVSPHWLDSNLEISDIGQERFLITDANAGARIECLMMSVERNVAPVY